MALLRGSTFILLFFLSSSSAIAQERLPSLVKKVQPSVVSVTTYDVAGEPLKQGSGFFVNEAGDVLTNRHVLRGATAAMVKTSDGRKYPVKTVVAEDENTDLVRVSITAPKAAFKPLRLTVIVPDVGERIVVVGSPLGLEHTVSEGIISAVRDVGSWGKIIQLSAPVSPGSSGSPVVNLKGEVIGVATFQLVEGQNLNFAVPALAVLRMPPGRHRTLAEWGELYPSRKQYPATEAIKTPRLETRKYSVAVAFDSAPGYALEDISKKLAIEVSYTLEATGKVQVVDVEARVLVGGELSIESGKSVVTLRLYNGYRKESVCRRYTGHLLTDHTSMASAISWEVMFQLTGDDIETDFLTGLRHVPAWRC